LSRRYGELGRTMTRVRQTQVSFRRPFRIPGYATLLPPGDYVVETEEELLAGLSFEAYRRLSTILHVDRIPGRPGERQRWTIDPSELDAAVAADQAS
jgi:hypothetical protein